MLMSRAVCLTYATLVAAAALPGLAFGQVPEPNSAPRLVVPARERLAPPPGQPAATPAATPAAAPAVPAAPVAAQAAPPATSSSAQAATAAPGSTGRSYAAANFLLTLGGIQVAALRSVEGGGATSDVVVEKLGPGQISKKHIAGVRYEDISLTAGLDSKPLLDWIAASWQGGPRKDGSILSADYNHTVVSECEFTHALITETTIPELDAASRDVAHLTVKIAPELTRTKAGSGAKAQGAIDARSQKKWIASQFRFEMAGLDGSKVSRIASFTVRQSVVENPVGEQREYQKEPARIEFPNLKITLAESAAPTWAAWHEDFVVQGNSGDDREKNGAIVFLGASPADELGRVNLFNCGIFRLAPQEQQQGSEAIARVTAELYCERMELVGGQTGK